MTLKSTKAKIVHLAEDDEDDCSMFEDVLNELDIETALTVSNDGVELMTTLDDTVPPPPYVVFLDLNMPLKNGYDCLKEIRTISKLQEIFVVILSTSCSKSVIDKLFDLGANYYICKPNTFELLKKSIATVLNFTPDQITIKPTRDEFLLKVA